MYVILHEEGKTITEVVEFVPYHVPNAIFIDTPVAEKFKRAIEDEAQFVENLRTGLPRKSRLTVKPA